MVALLFVFCFMQVVVPPGGVFYWVPKRLLVRATGELTDGWQLIGILQHNNNGVCRPLRYSCCAVWLRASMPWSQPLLFSAAT